jgi:aminoglycoside 6'-N-acetyltransferase I
MAPYARGPVAGLPARRSACRDGGAVGGREVIHGVRSRWGNGQLGGFLEASLRRYADGCSTSPVGYIEGWYVDDDVRRQGVGRQLVKTAEHWALVQGCREMASDCEIDNEVSFRAHLAIGYAEVERLIHFQKPLQS